MDDQSGQQADFGARDGMWTTQQVASLSGVTSRTLRHYDDIGLLVPTATGAGGIRIYDRDCLLRLQQILLLREFDLSLGEIQQILAGHRDELAALREQRDRLDERADRLVRLRQTIDNTITSLEDGRTMNAARLFDGFDPEKQEEYEEQLLATGFADIQRHIDESWRRIGEMTVDGAAQITQRFADVEEGVTLLLREGADPGDELVQQWIAVHYGIVCKFWTPDARSYTGLGDTYVTHPDFKARYDAHDERLAAFLRDAMALYATQTLAVAQS